MWIDQITAGARTVAQVAVHFDELKSTAMALRERGTATTRGYFTPREDDEARHLLVSYWHCRCALYDLVATFRQDASLPVELRPAAFVVAYGAAVLLIDAARFLRETFRDNAAVQAKLNEPDEAFGLPGGIYEQVQHSLTSMRNAWHMYHAQRYYDEHAAQLASLATEEPLASAWRVLLQYEPRARVPAARYAQALTRVRAAEIASSIDRNVVGRAMYGLLKLSGTLVADKYTRIGHQPALPVAVRRQLNNLLRPGDILVTRKEHALTNYFLPGYWPHAALYLGQAADLQRLGLADLAHIQPRWAKLLTTDTAEPRRVLEAMRDGVFIRSFASPAANDAIVALRPRLSESDVCEALSRLHHEGKPYDFGFDFTRSDRLVCTEVIYRSYDGVGGMQFDLTRRAGRMTLAAVDLLDMALARQGFEPLAVFAPEYTSTLVVGPEVDAILRSTRDRG